METLVKALKKLDKKISRENESLKFIIGKLYKLFTVIKNWYFEINIKVNNDAQELIYEVKRDLTNDGQYLNIKCGHNGVPNGFECMMIKRFIENRITLKKETLI